MTDQPLLSVIIPVYKAERSLRRCVDSLLCQLYTNLEIWLVDDGSPDGSPAICDDYAARDRRVHVIHQPNQGAFAARNAGLDAAAGALIGFVDADDWLEPNMYETLYALLRDTAADIAQCEMVNDGAYQQMRSVTLGGPVTYRREQLTEAMFRNEISHNLMNKLYRAEIWKGFHFQEGLYHLDAAFMCRLPERCARLSRNVAGRELVKIYQASDAMINILQEPLDRFRTILSLQCFAIPSTGRCLIAEYVEEAEAAFEPGKEILLFRTPEELLARVEQCLAEPGFAEAVGAAARRRCLACHTHDHRVAELERLLRNG